MRYDKTGGKVSVKSDPMAMAGIFKKKLCDQGLIP